jgi:hypothetical protein
MLTDDERGRRIGRIQVRKRGVYSPPPAVLRHAALHCHIQADLCERSKMRRCIARQAGLSRMADSSGGIADRELLFSYAIPGSITSGPGPS